MSTEIHFRAGEQRSNQPFKPFVSQSASLGEKQVRGDANRSGYVYHFVSLRSSRSRIAFVSVTRSRRSH